MTSQALGAVMREIAHRPEFWDELGDFGYLDGGCRIYAEAARAFLGDGAAIAYVVVEGDTYGPIVDHAVVIASGHVFDGDGASPIEGYLERYARLEQRGEAILELLHDNDLADDRDRARQARELPVNASLSGRLAAAWRAELDAAA